MNFSGVQLLPPRLLDDDEVADDDEGEWLSPAFSAERLLELPPMFWPLKLPLIAAINNLSRCLDVLAEELDDTNSFANSDESILRI